MSVSVMDVDDLDDVDVMEDADAVVHGVMDSKRHPRTRRQYTLTAAKIAEFIKVNFPQEYDVDRQSMRVPLSERALNGVFLCAGLKTKQKVWTMTVADVAKLFTDTKNIPSARKTRGGLSHIWSSLQYFYETKKVEMPPEHQKMFSDFAKGYAHMNTKVSSESKTKTEEGKDPLPVQCFHKMASNALSATEDFTLNIFAHTFMTLQWSLMARSNSVASLSLGAFSS